MKKVKFNVTSAVHMIPDEIYSKKVEEFKKMKYGNPTQYREYIMMGDEFPIVNVAIGEVIEVPDWYFNAHKDRVVEIPHNSYFKYDNGTPMSFSSAEAKKWGIETILKDKVKKFELIPDSAKAAA